MNLDEMPPKRRRQWKALMTAYGKGSTACVRERARQYLRDYPDDGYAWYTLGSVLTDLFLYDEAVRAFRKALALFPGKPIDMVYVGLGRVYDEKGSKGPAERWYRKAVEHSRGRTGNLVFLGEFLARQGRFAEAKSIFRRAIGKKKGPWEEAFLNMGLILRAEGKYEKAMECCEKALEIDPKYQSARRLLRDVAEAAKVCGNG